MHRASSFDIAGWAPSRDKGIELFSCASVPPAIVSKDDREWNHVLPPIVRGEHIDDGALFGSRRAVPFRFGHSPTYPGWLETTRLVAIALHWATSSFGNKRAETEAWLEVPGLDKLGVLTHSLGLRSDTSEGATGMAKLFRGDKQGLVWAKPVAAIIYHSQSRRM
jgi:hypothetical protein